LHSRLFSVLAIQRLQERPREFHEGRQRTGTLIAVLLVCSLITGCGALSRESSKTPRTAIEQLLLSQAAARSIGQLTIPLPPESSLAIDSAGLTPDQEFVRHVMAEQLSRLGYRVRKPDEKPTYLIRITLQGYGTEQGTSFLGMPPVQSVLIPFSLPEISIYKKVHQRGLIRLAVSVYRQETGDMISTSPWYEASTHYHQYVILLVFSWISTDLALPHERFLDQ